MEYRQRSKFQVVPVADGDGHDNEALPPGILVSKFDYSVENHFKVMDQIAMLSGESEFEDEQPDIQRLFSSVTFLRAWRDFCYQPRAIRFACESGTPQEKDVTAQLNLPQFSSAAVPKDMSDVNKVSSPLSKDFVMYVGGHVWALDWCPKVHQSSDFDVNVEFIAIAAHPPESSYHKIGAPLTGRGLIQIWCLLNPGVKDEDVNTRDKVKSRKCSKNNEGTKLKASQPKGTRGRLKKNLLNQSVVNMDDSDQYMQDQAVQFSENSNEGILQLVAIEETDKNVRSSNPQRPKGRPRKKRTKESANKFDGSNEHMQSLPKCPDNLDRTSDYPQPLSVEFPRISLFTPETIAKEDDCRNPDSFGAGVSLEHQRHNPDGNDASTIHEQVTQREYDRKQKDYSNGDKAKTARTSSKSRLTKCQTRIESPIPSQDCGNFLEQDPLRSRKNIAKPVLFEAVDNNGSISEDIALPRLVMGLAHNGRVAWDVKWRPSDSLAISNHRMGYLAVLLGNGALEVWEVPLLRATKAIFSCQKEGTDPRFIKLKPVFACSMVKRGDRQSIPLTLEWSTSAPHDLILAGCHDGVVALWKFSANAPSKDTRPLLCFSADTVPIRALKWAPEASDPESANIVVTAGHKGVKFWDIRDPLRPLWDIPAQRIIYSLDWLPDPRCVILSFDDGEIRIISLSKAASDISVTGMPSVKTQQHGSHSYHCSSSSIWSVQVSRLTGIVAYCCSDGKVIHFQLTTKAVEKDPNRNREPHYLCGSLVEDESTLLTVFSPLPNVPCQLKKSSNEWGDTPRSRRGFLSLSNQEKRAKEQLAKCQTPQKQSSGMLMVYQKVDASKTKNVEEEKEGFPAKMVAMHRVRWNMNKGSGRWLCYGGAAGIVRCQEIK